MVATVAWQASTAASATFSTVTQVRFKNANDLNIDLNNPMVKPSSSSAWDVSFEKSLRINVTGTFTQLSNLRLLASAAQITGANSEGIANHRRFTTTYGQPTEPASAFPPSGFTQLGTSPVTWSNAGTLSAGTSQWGDFVYLAVTVGNDSAVVAGTHPTSGTYNTIARYDEI